MHGFPCAAESAEALAQLMKPKMIGVSREDMEHLLADVGAHRNTRAIPYIV